MAQEAPAEKRRRPVLVWIISPLCVAGAIAQAMSHFAILRGRPDTPRALQQYHASWTAVDPASRRFAD
jgi:hypothetical protein